MKPEEGKKEVFEERLKKVEETIESIISTLEKIVDKSEGPSE